MDKKEPVVEQKAEGVVPVSKVRELVETAAERVANRIMAAFGMEEKAPEMTKDAEAVVETLPVDDKVKASIKQEVLKLASEHQALWVKAFALKLEQCNFDTKITASSREEAAKKFASDFIGDIGRREQALEGEVEQEGRHLHKNFPPEFAELAARVMNLGVQSPESQSILEDLKARFPKQTQEYFGPVLEGLGATASTNKKEEAMASEVKVTAEVSQNSKAGEVSGFQSGESASSGPKGNVPSVPGKVITEDKLALDVLPKADKSKSGYKTDYESEAASFDKEVEALKRGKGSLAEKSKLASVVDEITTIASDSDGLKLVESFVAYAKKKVRKTN